MMPFENPFYSNHIFTKIGDGSRIKATFRDKCRFIFCPTYVSCNEGYAWFWKRNCNGEILIVKVEELTPPAKEYV